MRTVKGIIIRVVDYKEKDKLLTIATFDKGIVCVNARGVRGANAKLKAYVNLLTFGEFDLTEAKNGFILSGVEVTDNFYNCWTDTLKYSACMLCIELFEKVANEQEESNFELLNLIKALKEINYNSDFSLIYGLWFMAKTAENEGVDFSGISDYNKEVYDLVLKLSKSDNITEIVDLKEINVLNGIKFLNLLYKSTLNINLKVIPEILKAL